MRTLRRLLIVGLTLALTATACSEAEQTAEEAGQQAEEAAEEAAQEAQEAAGAAQEAIDLTGSFELTGEVTDADRGRTPDVDIPAVSEDAPSEAARQPEDPGLLQVEASSTDETLASDCGTDEGDAVEVFWTNDTHFDPPDVLEDATFAENMQGRTITASGRYGTVDVDVGDEEPDDNPCILVAAVIEVGEVSS